MWPGLGGAQWVGGQTKGQTMYPGRRGVVRNQSGGLGLPRLIRKPPPSGGGGLRPADAGDRLCLQPTLIQGGTQYKIYKNKERGENKS